MSPLTQRSAIIATIAFVLSACAGGAGGSPSAPSGPPGGPPGKRRHQIDHVVIIIQENRTVDNLFQGFPGADTRSYGFDRRGVKIKLMPVPLEASWDFAHDSTSFLDACDGRGTFPGTDCKMDGFDREHWDCGSGGHPRCPNANPPYSYVPQYETRPYFFIGKHYVFADEMFPSNFDSSSFVSHQYAIAGQANSTVNFPIGAWGCEGGSRSFIPTVTHERTIGGNVAPCFNHATLGDELDNAGVSWRYYTSTVKVSGGVWSAYQAIKHIYDGPDWNKDVVSPQTQFFNDVSNGDLPAVSWITPTCRNSDHPDCGSHTGPDWVASLVNAIGESQYWSSTAIFVFWDDYGGWYDHVPPALVDYDGLGIRVPLLVVSAYAKEGCVSHVHYEHGSILKFVEDQFALPRLSASDARANPIASRCFDFSHAPRSFTKIPASHDERYFLRQPPDTRPPDTE
ncbi:MAG TPA: alkaline phosphatase family protein [Candidatus Cybelea sp.]|nr:alkaline phosphatase family protein [Candidatus Cybelea sp.]